MQARHVGRLAALAASLLIALSCSTTIPPANYYVLGSEQTSPRLSPAGKFPYTLSVAHFESAGTFLRKSIVWQTDENRVGYYSYERWAETPAEMFSYRLYQRVLESGLFRQVVWGLTTGEADLILKGKIASFEELDTPEGWYGKVQVEVALLKSNGTVLWSGLAGDTKPAAEEDVKSVVGAITNATEVTITTILSSIEQALEKQSAESAPH